MFNQMFVKRAINRSAENGTDRRRFLRTAGLAGLGAVGVGALGAPSVAAQDDGQGPSDSAILNFALNLEYLEAEFYLRALGEQLPDSLIGDNPGPVSGGRPVQDLSGPTLQYAREIADDEKAHVAFLRKALGSAAVDRPAINLDEAFVAAGMAAGVQGFDPYANALFFLHGAFIFEDVGVTAYKGAAPLVDNKTFLEAAAGILAVEAYHASNIRTALVAKGVADENLPVNPFEIVKGISDARDSLDNPDDVDQGIGTANNINIVPADDNGIAFSRTPGDVLNIVYLTAEQATSGGFFPQGVNGPLRMSSGMGPSQMDRMPGGGVDTGGGSTAGW